MFTFASFLITLLSCLLLSSNALPLVGSNTKLQTVFYQEKTKLYDVTNIEEWFMSQEYDMFSTITDYYENMVDSTLSSESEELLLNLIHLPQETKENILQAQGKYLGIESLSDNQIKKMPVIIGKHIQAMNTEVYESVENIITLYWRTIWDPKLLSRDNADQQEERISSFLSSFNGIIAKNLMDQIEEYQLLQKIKSELLNVPNNINQDDEQHEGSVASILIGWFKNTINTLFSTPKKQLFTAFEFENDFLRQHLTDIRTSLLMELHIQFMDFFTRIQSDILDQLSTYYNE